MPVAREAMLTAQFLGNEVELVSDVGVAGIHRLFHRLDIIQSANVLVVCAGMEGALASVVGGLVDKPVIAVPTSIGYGANFEGLSALLAMLNSCASGVSVVNIDNGFGAGFMAHTINCLGGRNSEVLYFDCSSGISGNMTLGALSELIDDPHYLVNELKKLNVDGYHIHISKEKKNGITGTYVDVHLEHEHHHEHEHEHLHHEHAHHHHHEHRNLFDVNKIIDESEIDEKAKDLAKRIFLRVAKAESKVHNETLENVHFHEVGAIDSIVDIIGTAILLCKINPDVIYSSVVNDGYGFIECAHGMISVPVPATSEIFAASNAITRQIDVDTELVTPTGAAIIAEIASEFTTMPAMNVQKVGWGTGTKDLVIPNVLKVSLGEI